MTPEPIPPHIITELSSKMDARLAELATSEAVTFTRALFTYPPNLPMPEKEAADVNNAVIEVGQDPDSFWQRFQKAARLDICQEGGVLHAQWQKWGDLSNEKVLAQFTTILVAMGFTGNILQLLALSCGVIVVHIGVKAYCMEAEAAQNDTNATTKGEVES